MKRLVILLAVFALMAAACDDTNDAQASEPQGETEEADDAATASVKLDVDGMTCVNCAADIEEGFDEADGIVEGRIDFGERRAYVDYDDDALSIDDVIAIVEERGYEAAIAE